MCEVIMENAMASHYLYFSVYLPRRRLSLTLTLFLSFEPVKEKLPIYLASRRGDRSAANINFASYRWLLVSLGVFCRWNELSTFS